MKPGIKQGGLVGFAVWQSERKAKGQAPRTRSRVLEIIADDDLFNAVLGEHE